jgi:hypothetical protein
MGIVVKIPDDPTGLALFTLACLCAAWGLIFVWRFFVAIGNRHAAALTRIGDLTEQLKPKVRLSFHPESEGLHKAIVKMLNPTTRAVERESEATYA